MAADTINTGDNRLDVGDSNDRDAMRLIVWQFAGYGRWPREGSVSVRANVSFQQCRLFSFSSVYD